MAGTRKQRFRENPFVLDAVMHTVTGNKIITGNAGTEELLVVAPSSGEIGLTGFYQRISVDKTHFIKLYAGGIQALLNLKPAGTKVFSIIYRDMLDDSMYNKDRIILDYDMLNSEDKEKVSRTVWFRGIKNLIEERVIAATLTDQVFWINPDYIYRGDRLALCKEYIMKPKKNITPRPEAIEAPKEQFEQTSLQFTD